MLGEGEGPVRGHSSGRSENGAEKAEVPAGPDTGLACLVMLLKFWGRAAEPEQIRHQRGKGNGPFSVEDILLACKQVEVKARAKKADWKKLVKMPLPAIGRDQQGRFFIIAKIASNDNSGAEEKGGVARCPKIQGEGTQVANS